MQLLKRFCEQDGDDDEDDGISLKVPLYDPPIRVSAFYLQRMSVLDDVVNEDVDDHFHDFSVDESKASKAFKDGAHRRQLVIEVNCSWDSPVGKHLLEAPAVTDKNLDCTVIQDILKSGC